MNKKILTGVIIGGTILTTALSAYAYNGSNTTNSDQSINTNRQAIMEALESSDYQTWYNLIKDTKRGEELSQVINESNFSKYVEAHNLMQNGDIDGAKVIFDELGVPAPKEGGHGRPNNENMEAVKSALENNDYNAWLEAISNMPNASEMTTVINESNFSKMVEIHTLMQAGDMEGAQKIADELGLPNFMAGKGRGGERGNGQDMKEIMNAISNGDYETFISLLTDQPFAEELKSKITSDNFSSLKEILDLVNAGSYTEAKDIADELGLDTRFLVGGMHFKGNMGNSSSNNS